MRRRRRSGLSGGVTASSDGRGADTAIIAALGSFSAMASAGPARTGEAEVDSAMPLSGGRDSLLGNQEYRCPLSPGN